MRSLHRNIDRSRWTLCLKLLLLVAFIAATNGGAWDRLQALAAPSHAAAFLALWGMSSAALFCVAFSPCRSCRYLWTLVFIVCSLLALTYSLVTRTQLSLADAEQLLEAVAFADNVLGFYAGPLLAAAVICLVGILALNMPPFWPAGRAPGPAWPAAALLLPFLPVAATAGVLYARGGQGTDGLPVQFTSPAFAVVLGLERLLSGPPPVRRQVVIDAAAGPERLRHVVVIMDESVRGDLLDINRAGGVYSGLLPHDAAMANFGVMSSISTCSAPTNAGFRYGVSRASYLDDLAANPSIWGYARKAGYRTVYVDGQRHGGRLMNLMTAAERAEIDHHIQLPAGTAPMARDIEIARLLRNLIQREGPPSFVFVNKMGAHFPYEGKYPSEHAPYQPALKRTYFGTEIDPKDIWTPTNDSAEARLRLRNSYMNALAWNVGMFFETLLAGLDLSRSAIVYMADHGQNVNEDGRPGYHTHCTTGPAPAVEAMVPLVVLTRLAPLLAQMREAAHRNRDRVSQFNVFPAVLALLGYRPGDVARFASAELPFTAELPPGQRQFLSRFFVRLGRGPIWNSLDERPAVYHVVDKSH